MVGSLVQIRERRISWCISARRGRVCQPPGGCGWIFNLIHPLPNGSQISWIDNCAMILWVRKVFLENTKFYIFILFLCRVLHKFCEQKRSSFNKKWSTLTCFNMAGNNVNCSLDDIDLACLKVNFNSFSLSLLWFCLRLKSV